MNILKQALGGISGGRVLDVASGEGDFIKTLVGSLRSYEEIIGIDIIEHKKAPGSIFGAEDVRFLQMDAERLDFGDESFHTVSISNSLHHLKDIPRCVGEMKRVLKPGGHLIIRETHRDIQTEPQLTDMYIHHWVAEIDSALGHTHHRTFARRELVDLAEGLGLSEIAFYDISNTDSDPTNEAAVKDSEEVIERYMRHAEGLSGHGALRERGQELRRRLHRVGIQWEPELIIVGRKQ